ncbi:RNA polymerase II C-terminal domain phosphatase-like 4 [Silene latifolia]|uniref:RNA polymerase II C-terminal domain phosphatase-like 4 n=1 Tax=Silene latifolia TaxID=37657 RepID=UPI003D78761F
MIIEGAMQENQCPHNVFLDDKCLSCKLRKSDCPNITTIPVNYLRCGDNMSLSLSAIDRFRVQDLQVILGQRKLNLILDLDNTLIHSKKPRKFTLQDKKNVTNDSYDLYKVEGSSRLVKLSPEAREFLKKVREMFQLSIYTLGKRDYAQRIASLLAGGSNLDIRSMFGKIISKEDSTRRKRA